MVTILTVALSGLLSPPLFTACTDTVYTVNSCRLLRVTDESPGLVVACLGSALSPSAETVYVRDRSASAAGSHFTSREAPPRMTRSRLVGAAIKWIIVDYLRAIQWLVKLFEHWLALTLLLHTCICGTTPVNLLIWHINSLNDVNPVLRTAYT